MGKNEKVYINVNDGVFIPSATQKKTLVSEGLGFEDFVFYLILSSAKKLENQVNKQ